ncbi:hypothetical protein E2562_020121, partial [Oryza meyeriana var. granulata]
KVDHAKQVREACLRKTRRFFTSSPIFELSLKLSVTEGSFNDSHIVVMLGENGTGKMTFIRMLAGRVKPDSRRQRS